MNEQKGTKPGKSIRKIQSVKSIAPVPVKGEMPMMQYGVIADYNKGGIRKVVFHSPDGQVTRPTSANIVRFEEPTNEVVMLPRREYDELCKLVTIAKAGTDTEAEVIADVATYDEARAAINNGEDELIPEEFADRLLDGENPLTVYRELRGLTIKTLAAQAYISAPYLSQIEHGDRDGPLTTWKALAHALNVTLDDIA